MATTTKLIEDKSEWEKFLSLHREANFLQSWYWGQFHEAIGNKIHRTGFYDGKKIVGVMLSIIEDAKRGRYLTVPAGPIIDWENKDVIKSFTDEVTRIAKEDNCVFVRVRPQLESNKFSKSLFAKLGFNDAPMHLHAELTSQLDITRSEDDLLAGMKKNTRYNVRKGESLGIKVTSTIDPTSIKKFYDLQIETAKRQKFTPFSYEYLFEQFKVFASDNKVLMYTAELNKKLLAQAFIVFYGEEAVYHYGASTQDGRKYPGAYLIQWEAIKEAKRRGMKKYNFWGVSPADNPNHRFAGLSLFKRGFGGEDFEYLHAQDLVIDSHRYALNFIIESLRKRIRSV